MSTTISVKERPILFSGPMVLAILSGAKTQTRRIVKPVLGPQADWTPWEAEGCWKSNGLVSHIPIEARAMILYSPYGVHGDRLWVKETFLNNALAGYTPVYFYRADDPEKPEDRKWRPSIFCPRTASRITLEIESVRVERLQDISEADAKAEGCDQEFRTVIAHPLGTKDYSMPVSYRAGYANLWNRINDDPKDHSKCWEANPWVWVLEFKRISP